MKLLVVNPYAVDIKNIISAAKGMPIRIIVDKNASSTYMIDTNIKVWRKK
jgi:hypothetical protein